VNQTYSVAMGDRTSLNQLFDHLRATLAPTFTQESASQKTFVMNAASSSQVSSSAS
jgi:hypothetical protein